jgi:hypothetical protein
LSVFVDTSALLALMDAGDDNHARAIATWDRLAGAGRPLTTSNYVLVETFVGEHGTTRQVARLPGFLQDEQDLLGPSDSEGGEEDAAGTSRQAVAEDSDRRPRSRPPK